MRSSQSRRCTLLDVMALIAATAIGFSLARTYSLEVLSNDFKRYPFLPRVLLTSWAYILAVLPVPAMWSIALFGLSLRRPRPDLRRLARQPGFVAAGAVTLVVAIRLAGFLTLIARTIGNRFSTIGALFDVLAMTGSYRGPVNVATVYNTAYFASSAFGTSMAVASLAAPGCERTLAIRARLARPSRSRPGGLLDWNHPLLVLVGLPHTLLRSTTLRSRDRLRVLLLTSRVARTRTAGPACLHRTRV